MAITATNIRAKITPTGGISSQTQTLTLKNTLKDQITVRELANVIEGSPTDGDILIYNSVLNKYEVKPITINANTNITDIDGGTF
jgi:hypothetical protein